MKFEHETFDFHGVFIYPDVIACPQGTHAGTCGEEFWRKLLSGGNHKRSKEQSLKELGF